jgi:hypothetical protein
VGYMVGGLVLSTSYVLASSFCLLWIREMVTVCLIDG